MELNPHPLPADIEYFLDAALEHEEIDAATHLVLKMYANRVELMNIIDLEYKHTGIVYRTERVRRCDDLVALADRILAMLPSHDREPIAWAGVRHMRHWVNSAACCMAYWAHQDGIIGGCMLPYKRAKTAVEQRRMTNMETTPRQRRRIYGPNWIRRRVKIDDDTRRLRGIGRKVLARIDPLQWSKAREQSERLAIMLEAQHEAYRRTNERALAAYAQSLKPTKSKSERKKDRKIIVKSLACAESIVGTDAVRKFVTGQRIVLSGETIAIEVGRNGSSATMGHGGLSLTAICPSSGRKLANLCLYHEKTPALDQLAALSLAITAGEEGELLATANLSNITDLGASHPLISNRANRAMRPAARSRDIVVEKNEAYWQATKPIWVGALGVEVLGDKVWRILNNARA